MHGMEWELSLLRLMHRTLGPLAKDTSSPGHLTTPLDVWSEMLRGGGSL